ncbi:MULTISPECIES: integrase core domain-containing protein [Comamonas]|uniref:integrase core domain-containing protein n=1 Tax=Comamonas TaxID=283 RepID=UPI0034E28CAE
MQNAYVERFNRSCRTEVLDCDVYGSVQEVRSRNEGWQHFYNHYRLHESLSRRPPVAYFVKSFTNLCFYVTQESEGASHSACLVRS